MTDFLEDAPRIRVAILGSTGSIGTQALDVIRQNPERFEVTALSAGSNSAKLAEQAAEFGVGLLGLGTGDLQVPQGTNLIKGAESAAEIARQSEAEIVLNAVVGAAGLGASMATLTEGKTLALANKESLVAAGELVMSKAAPGQIRPVDSEHSALWQLLNSMPIDAVRKCYLTGSGGPFRGRSSADLEDVSVEQALAHPVWEMGDKITIDSATLMNKGLEVIEAHFLFGFTYDEIEVLIHPQALIHAMVRASDGSVLAHAGVPDMRVPIQVALAWPQRLGSPGEILDWATVEPISFEPPDLDAFPSLALAYEAGRQGDTYPAVLNASNEVAVRAFLDGQIKFPQIPAIVEETVSSHVGQKPELEEVLEADRWAREVSAKLVESKGTAS